MKNSTKPTTYIKVIFVLLLSLSFNFLIAQQLAFPSALGAGAYTTGGRGGTVVHVTNLNDSGAGSLREALSSPNRIVVFDVSGVINLESLLMSSDNITIAGQTAPEGGITIDGRRVLFWDTDNVIVRYIRFKGGVDADTTIHSGLQDGNDSYTSGGSVTNQIFDHCSFAFGKDEAASFSSKGSNILDKVTVQRSFFAESVKAVIFSGSVDATFGEGSFINNLFYNAGYRTPNTGGNISFDIINNVNINSAGRLISNFGPTSLNHIGNYTDTGRMYYSDQRTNLHRWSSGVCQIYTEGNKFVIPLPNISSLTNSATEMSVNNRLSWHFDNQGGGGYSYGDQMPDSYFVDFQFPLKGKTFTPLTADEAYADVINNVGCNARLNADGSVSENFDTLDAQWLDDAMAGMPYPTPLTSSQYTVPDFTSVNREDSFYDTNPHIPEAFLQANGLTGNPTIHNVIAPSGYTWLEEYLNQVDYVGMLVSLNEVHITENGESIIDDNIEIENLSTLQLGINFIPSNATNQDGVWSTSNSDVATVDANGLVTANEVGSATITFTADDGGVIDTVEITVFPEALLASAGNDQSICEGDSAILTASGGTSYLWNTGETTETINVTPDQTSIYSVLVSDDYGQSEEVSVEVVVNQAPIIDLGEDQIICQGESVTLSATNGDTYLWNTGETTASIEVSPDSETVYNVEVFSGNCSSIDSITITVRDAPNITVSDDIVIVEGDSTTLAVNGSDNYLWSTGETEAFITVTPAITTTYDVISTNPNGCSTRLEVTVTVIPEVIANAGTDTAICRDEIVTLTATGGGSYLWNTGETTAELVVSPIVTTTYAVTVEDDYGYTDTDSVTITVNETPDITVSNDVVIIEGESATLTAENGDNYLWNTGETTAELIVSPLVTTTYTVISVADGGCADIEQVTVTVIPEVIANAGEDITICSGEVVTLVATGGGTYLWNTGATTAEFDVSPLTTTTYIVTVEDDYGYTDTDSVTINVNQTPDISVSDDIMIMDGDSTTLNASGGSNYEWSTGETTESIVVSPTVTTIYTVSSFGEGGCNDTEQVTVTVIPELVAYAGEDVTICSGEITTLTATGGIAYLWDTGDSTAEIEVSPLTTTTYTVTVEDVFGNIDSDSVTVTVNQTPSITVSDDVVIMDGQTTTITANGGDNYQWSTNETTASIVVSPTITTTYTVTSLGIGGCNDSKQVTVTVVPELVANAGSDQEICNGEIIILNASGGVSYTWNTGDIGPELVVSPNVTTTYSVTVEDSFGNSDTDSVIVTVNELPEIIVSGDVLIMNGDSTTLTVNGSDNYLWSTGETSASITVSPSVTTTYTVVATGEGDCQDIEQVTVTVIPEVIANAGEDVTICSGETTILNATGGGSYIWSTGANTAQLEVSPTVTTTYTVIVENDFGYTDTDSIVVTVNDPPVLTISQDITIIEGESTTLEVSGAETYLWNNGAPFSSIIVSPLYTSTYIVIGTSNGCSTEAQVTVTVEEPFFASAGQDERVCSEDTYEVILTANQGDSYLWSTGEITQTIAVSPLETTIYSVTVTRGTQQDTDNVTVYVDPNPEVVIVNGDSVDIMAGDFITLSATGANTYEWNNGATQPNIAVSPSTTTTYEVKGYVGDCYDEKQVTVNVIPSVEADAGEDVIVCSGETATLTATGGDEYEWSTGETTQTIQVSPTVTTQYTVTVFNALDFDEDSVIVTVDDNCEEDDDDDEEIVIPIDEALDFDFKIFPNPASDIVNVKLSGSTHLTKIYLYDITGKLIYKSRVSNDNLAVSSTKQIDVSNLQPGLYHVKMIDINREISKKLIVN